jgi:3-oxoacyl-[acyl-carrier protein] reductase
MKDLDFSNKTVVITGGSAGIGYGTARMFVDAGAQVVVTGTREAGEYDADYAGMTFHRLDDSDTDAVRVFADAVPEADVLINCIGTVLYKKQEFEVENFKRILDINLSGIMQLCMLFREKLVAREGNIINVSSVAAYEPALYNPAYSASKAGLVMLTRNLAVLWGRDGVRVNGIAPGFVATKLTAVSRDNEAIYEGTLKRIPLKRWGTAEEMGSTALFLASPMASYITGQTILVDGGTTAL